jgi:hypothetical protein
MEGGIGIALLIIAGVVIGGFVIFMYFTGGAIAVSDDDTETEKPRPQHTEPTTPMHENVRQVPEGQEINT